MEGIGDAGEQVDPSDAVSFMFPYRALKDVRVPATRRVHANPCDVVTRTADRSYGVQWKILVRQEKHQASHRLKPKRLLLGQCFRCILPTRQQILALKTGIIAKDLQFRPALP